MKSSKPHEQTNQKQKMLNLLVKNWKLMFWCSLFHFFIWFARFQILICEPQRILHKLLLLSWLWRYLWFYIGPSQQAVTSWWWLNFAIVFNFWYLSKCHKLVAIHILLFYKPIFESLSTSKRKLSIEWIFTVSNSM